MVKPNQTPGTRFVDGVPVFFPNSVYSGDGFYVSHNNIDYRIYGDETTALVRTSGRTEFYILNGDHRNQYMELMSSGYAACKAYYDSLPKQHNSMSDTEESLEQLAKLLKS